MSTFKVNPFQFNHFLIHFTNKVFILSHAFSTSVFVFNSRCLIRRAIYRQASNLSRRRIEPQPCVALQLQRSISCCLAWHQIASANGRECRLFHYCLFCSQRLSCIHLFCKLLGSPPDGLTIVSSNAYTRIPTMTFQKKY